MSESIVSKLGRRCSISFIWMTMFAVVAAFYHFLSVLLTLQSVARGDVSTIADRPEELVRMVANGEVDAFLTWQPHGIHAEILLADNGITFSSQGIHTESFNLCVRTDFIQSHQSVIDGVARALARAGDLIRYNPQTAINLAAAYSKTARELIASIWSLYIFGTLLEQSLLLTLEDESRWAIRDRHAEQIEKPNFLDHVHLESLAKARPNAVTVIH